MIGLFVTCSSDDRREFRRTKAFRCHQILHEGLHFDTFKVLRLRGSN